jgi:hypothetical protein
VGQVQRAFETEIGKMPKSLLSTLLTKKLTELGLDQDQQLIDSLSDHILKGNKDQFTWKNPETGVAEASNIEINISDDDAKFIESSISEFTKNLPAVLEEFSIYLTKNNVKYLKKLWRNQRVGRENDDRVFKAHIAESWGKSFDCLRMILTACQEISKEHFRRVSKSKAKKNLALRHTLLRLHARSCQITAEIITLMEAGYADGAMARWRTLYEIEVVATVILAGGERLAESYLEHEAVESKLAMDEYSRCQEAIGCEALNEGEKEQIQQEFDAAIQKNGAQFGKPYGWAAKYLNVKKVRFSDLEESADRSSMRSYYKMASYSVHADTKGIFFQLSSRGRRQHIIAGASDTGFVEPAQNTAFTLVQMTALLLNERMSDLDEQITLKTLMGIRDDVVRALNVASNRREREARASGQR